jgi:transglutaminase-like putative cysteine protease
VASSAATAAQRVGQFFQLSLVLLLANGFFAILFTGRLDPLISLVMGASLLLRLLRALDVIRFELPQWAVTLLSLLYVVFYPLDYLLISRSFIPATIRMMFFFTALKMLSAKTGRDYFYLGLLAFLHLLAASMFVAGVGYLGVLLLFLCLATAAIVSFEVKRGCESGARIVEDLGSKNLGLGSRLAAASAALAVGMLTLSMALFLVLPRLIGRSPVAAFGLDQRIGFSSEVDLGATGVLRPDHTPVMRVQRLEGAVQRLRWRGVALSHFDGRRWSSPATRSQLVDAGSYATPRRLRHSQEGTRIHYRVMLEPLASQALFVAGVPEQIISGSFDRLVVDETDSLRVLDAGLQSLQYEVFSWVTDRSSQRPADVAETFSQRFQRLYLQLPSLDPRVRELALQISGARVTALGRAEAIESFLRNEFGYTLDLPSERQADPLAHFLFERRKGHCEYFASAMTVMLRTLGIPARLINGFAGGVENPISGLHVIRSRDAHSWVEAYIPTYGWIEFDPTPPAPDTLMNPWMAQLWMYWDAVQSAWSDWVLEYDFSHQIQLAHAVQDHTRNAALFLISSIDDRLANAHRFWESLPMPARAAGSTPRLLVILVVAAIAGAVLGTAAFRKLLPLCRQAYHTRRLKKGHGRPSDCTFFYRRALGILARRGIARHAWQTPDEFWRSTAEVECRGLLQQITAAYNAARYGRDPVAEQVLPGLVQALERARF